MHMDSNTDQLLAQNELENRNDTLEVTPTPEASDTTTNNATSNSETVVESTQQTEAVEKIVDFANFTFVNAYPYNDEDKIVSCSTGMLLHRLHDHVMDIVSKKFNHPDKSNYSTLFNQFIF